MGALMRSIDWARTPLGAVETWPTSLRTALGLVLGGRFPMLLWWGDQLIQLYNDAYRPILGAKHPRSLGAPGAEVWEEIWHIIGPQADDVRAGGPATWNEHLLLPMLRNGFLEETYFTFSYSPVPDDSGRVGGVLVTCQETTAQVQDARQLRTLRELGTALAQTRSAEEACEVAARILGANTEDVPSCRVFLAEEAGTVARRVATAGFVESEEPAGPFSLQQGEGAPRTGPWPLGQVARTGQPAILRGSIPSSGAEGVPEGGMPHATVCVPLSRPGQPHVDGFLVCGTNPMRPLDERYLGFFRIAADQVVTAISNARVWQEERRRAEALAEADRAKTVFFSNVSHEFRTPLTLMLGPVEDCLSDTRHPLPEPHRERLALVRRNGLRLQKLVNSLLDFARLEAGRAQAHFVPTDLATLTADLASSFRSAMEAAGLELTVECPPLPEPVLVDPSAWEKVVLNLLSNAFKHTLRGGVRVGLRWLGGRVELSVRDTGTGIPPEELPRVFERFHRVQGAIGRSHEGSGIGLALVSELVKLHGGTVDVRSTLGEGSTFTVTLPTGTAHLPAGAPATGPRTFDSAGAAAFLVEATQWSTPPPAGPPPEEGAAGPVPSTLQTGARILVVDDNADMRGYLVRLLSAHWHVEAVGDGLRALAAARARPPDLVLSDVMMPGLDGLGLLRELRADERTRTTPVVLLSARAGEEATVDGLKAGADDYLVKPFAANELLARVNAQLTLSRLRHEALAAERAHAAAATRLLAEAERATRSREEMLAVVSHDLRTPLTSVFASVELMERALAGRDGEASLKKHLASIRRAAGRMRRLIGDLLDLASIDTGTLSLDRQPHAPEELVRDVREAFEPLAREKQLAFDLEVEPGLPVLVCDRERVFQALSNLLANAIKFTPEGGRVALRVHAREGGLDFLVEDTGPGIAAEALPRIFERHWHTAQKGREGHGLGLPIAHGIIAAHGGRIDVASTPGQGSRFTVQFPVAVVPVSLPEGRAPEGGARFPRPPGEQFLQGGGELGALMRSTDWAKTELGAVATWPQSLRTAIGMMLSSQFAMVVAWGPRFRFFYNDRYRPIIGSKHPAALGTPTRDIFPEVWSVIGPLIERTRTGESVALEDMLLPLERSGYLENAWFTMAYSPIRDESGGVGGMLAVVVETTERVEGERRLATLRTLARQVSDARTRVGALEMAAAVLQKNPSDVPFALLYVTSGDGKSARLAASAGLSPGEAGAPAGVDLVGPGAERDWPLARALRSRQLEVVTDVVRRFGGLPGGTCPEPAHTAVVLPLAKAGADHASCFLVAGVSPRRAFDERYRAFFELAGEHVLAAIANADAYSDERRRAESLAELDRAKTAFFSNISHEFRTPLTLLLGPVEDALADATKPLTGERLAMVWRNVLRLSKMVNGLLDFSRVEAGSAQAVLVPTDLSAFTSSLASAFRSAAEHAGLRLTVDCPPLPVPVLVDPEMWEKVLFNLLSNAVKYTHQGEVGVSLRAEDGQVVLVVRDTGVGIPESALPHLFERFYRVRATRGRSHEGTGIGLSLVRELVTLHGGTVDVASRLGEGSAFTVRLPARRAESGPVVGARPVVAEAAPFVEELRHWTRAPEPESGDEAAAEQDPALAEARILVADDNADLRAYVTGLLRRDVSRVEAVADGSAALERAREWRPDLILSDVMMPGLDGFALVRELRADARTRTVPVILLSARAGEEATVEGMVAGADDYLVKPFSARELRARVRTTLELARVRREVAAREALEASLREAVRARDEFLSAASHELKTPLAAFRLNLDLIERGLSEDSRANVQEKLMAASRQVQRLRALLERLLDVSLMTTGRLQLARSRTDLGGLVLETVARLRDELARSGTRVEARVEDGVGGDVDPARVRQVLTGLLQNAAAYAQGRPVEVELTRRAGRARLRVVDHGPGIRPEDRARLFERFERAVPTRHHSGLGVGLWMARVIVEAHGGALSVEDTPGGGATFVVELPLGGPGSG
ncbi:response regulator [Pyxidicoccus fallax]|uniref:histidine kinase n=4 Tax=Pyxidicoccus fallax TaxID=394095 RepID=A0A848L7V4_9BACT|nr:response regulator [Pyxidicoccus fallax]